MNKLFTKIASLALGAAMAFGVGVAVSSKNVSAVSAANTTIAAADVVSGSSYKAHSTSNWVITFGGNNSSVGTNNGNRSKCNLSSYSKYAVSPVTTSNVASAFVSLSPIANIKAISYTFSGGSNQGSTSVYAIYSSNNSTFSQLSLTSGTQGHTISSGTKMEFSKCTGYFGLLFKATNSSGNWRIDAVTMTLEEGASGTTYTVSYDKNNAGASGTMTDSNSPYSSGASVTVLHNSFTPPTGYTFDHWNTAANNGGTSYNPGDTFSISGNTTLYAQWVADSNTYVTYTASSRSAVSTSGTAPAGSSATYYNTYNNTNQMTGGNSVTLTLSGYDGCTINKLTVSVKSNNSSGAGSLSFVSDSTTIGSIADSAFNTSNWNGSWSGSYVNKVVSVSSTKIGTGKTVVLTISASQNSLFFQSATIGYTPNTDASVTIATATTSLTYDGSNNQTVTFTATPENFGSETVSYEWRTSNASVIGVTGVGSAATANLKILGAGNANITVYASSTSKNATSAATAMTVTNETYSGTLTITSAATANVNDSGTITYTLSGNTHPMNTVTFSSSNTSAISFANANNPAFTTGSTKGSYADVTVNLSSSVYSLETYSQTIRITLVDPNSVTGVHYSGDIANKTVNFGGNYTLTAVLECESGNPTDKVVSWESANTSIVTVAGRQDSLIADLTPVSPGVTTVTVTTHDGGYTKDCTVTVTSTATRVLDGVEIHVGANAKTSYYDDATEIDFTDITLSAHYYDPNYATYSETVNVAVDAEGVEWDLDLENEEISVSFGGETDSFSITVSEAPATVTYVAADHTDFADGAVYVHGAFTFTVADNDAATPSTYNQTQHDNRLYNGATLTINSDSSVEKIDTISYTYTTKDSGKGNSFTVTTNGTSYSQDGLTISFTGTTTEVVFTAGASQFRIVTIEINYTKVQAQDIDVESVSVSPSTATIESGYTTTLSVVVLPANARDTSVTWSTSNANVATVDTDGVVTGVSAGVVTITATSNDQDTISSSATITVTAGPVVHFATTAKIEDESGTQIYLGDAFYNLTVSGGTYRGTDSRGSQYSSSTNEVNVSYELTDIAVASQDLRVIINAAKASNGAGTISAKLGSTDLVCDSETSVSLTTTSEDYEFTYSGSPSSTVNLSDLVKVTLNNTGGAVYFKSIKVYSGASQSVIGNFTTNSLRMESYDQGGSEGSTGGNGSCKTWWSDVLSSYNGLTDGQKSLFGSENKYIAARARLSEWARNNGYTFNPSDGTISKSVVVNPISLQTKSSGTEVAIIVVSMIGLSAVGGYFFLRKRKENI